MRIASVTIKNFRVFASETVFFDDYTCAVGPNGSGKSTILTALNIFFRDTVSASTDLVNLGKEDFHRCDTSQPITITVTFQDLSVEAKADLKDYVRQDKLVISSVATWSDDTGSAAVEQHGERLGIEAFRSYFEKEKQSATAKDLQAAFAELKKSFPDLSDAKTKAAMEQALREYEAAHPDQCTLIPSPDQFYGFSKGTNRLQKYVQWVFVPPSKMPQLSRRKRRARLSNDCSPGEFTRR
jgi:energy-coupling factor transporter ATP-binding protein EcfA2